MKKLDQIHWLVYLAFILCLINSILILTLYLK